ncbi:MAG TPA: HAD-IIB family hydrolase [Candidatus Yaniella excrementigallinarum]|nr:HAD-IIB family hydrolase [Candidatus Yaniella excrementigallinarum]
MPEHLAPHGAEVERDKIGHPLTRPQLIATDLDGTIIPYSQTHTGFVSPRTLAAFHAAQEAGVGIAFVTGRPMRWMSALAPILGPMGPAIVSNGAIIYNMNTDTVLEAHPMDQYLVTDVANELRGIYSGAIFGAETLTGLVMEPQFISSTARAQANRQAHRGQSATEEPTDSVAVRSSRWIETANITYELAQHPEVVKLMVKVNGHDPDDLLLNVRAHFGKLVQVTHSAPGVSMLEISRGDVHKAATLADYAESLGVHANDVVAFGDQRNDEQMLRWAGTGYALESGHPGLLEQADVIAPACDDDGVAEMIEHLMTLPE